MGSRLLSPQGQTGAWCTFLYLSKVFVNCAKSSVWLCLYCYIIVTIAKVARKVSQILNPKWYILNGQQSNIKGTYFAGPLLILQHWKGKSQLSKVHDFMGRPAALVGRKSTQPKKSCCLIKDNLYPQRPKWLLPIRLEIEESGQHKDQGQPR